MVIRSTYEKANNMNDTMNLREIHEKSESLYVINYTIERGIVRIVLFSDDLKSSSSKSRLCDGKRLKTQYLFFFIFQDIGTLFSRRYRGGKFLYSTSRLMGIEETTYS